MQAKIKISLKMFDDEVIDNVYDLNHIWGNKVIKGPYQRSILTVTYSYV
jgi:hypothetical protein